MAHNSLKRAPHPPYSPDLTPSDFYLFVSVKQQFQGHEFTEGAELVSAISEFLNQIPTDTLVDVFNDWTKRSQQCIDISGEYVEYRLYSLFMDFHESLTLAMLQSGLNALYLHFRREYALKGLLRTPGGKWGARIHA
jgi:hypothetical protein